MGLVNLFNAIAMRPHIPYRFRGEIWPNSMPTPERDDKAFYPMEFTIKRISQPVFKLDTENKVHFGNTAYVVPILKFGETTMEITFEETDNMRVFKMLSGFLSGDVYKGVYGGLINIRVTQYDETMTTITDKKVYVCRLQEHGMPQFNNNGFGSPVEISATFNVIYVMEEPLTLEGSTDDNLPTIVHEALPDNEYLTSELAKVAEEEQKQQKKIPELPKTGRRTPEMEKRTQEAQERLQKKSDELNSATNNLLDVYYIQNQDAVDKYLNDSNSALSQNAWKNFANERAKQFGTGKDASTLTPEERAKLEDEWKHMKSRDKFKYGTGIDASDGLDDTEIDLMYKLIGNIDDEAMQEDYNERLSGILDKNIEYNNAKAEYEEAKNESLPPGSGSGSNSTFNESDPIRYREGAKTNAAAGVDNLDTAMKAGRITDANGNQVTSTADLKSRGQYFVDGHEYKAVFYDGKWSLNSNVKGNDFDYERPAKNPEEVFQNVLADGPIKYNLGGKSDGNIKDGLDCMGFVGIVMQATGADVINAEGKKVKYDNVKEVFSNYNTANFYNNDFKVVVPPGTDMKVFVAKKGKDSGHIIVEYNGYIYESAGGSGVKKTEKSKWNDRGLKYKDVTASEEQVAQFHRNSKNKTG